MTTSIADMGNIVKAIMSNQIARIAPSIYMTIVGETGRGAREEELRELTNYYMRCFDEYLDQGGFDRKTARKFCEGQRILEYGPGDILGVALLMYAYGAEMVHCVDRFALKKISAGNIRVYHALLESMDGERKKRGRSAFKRFGVPESGFREDAIRYSVTPNGLSGAFQEYDLVLSRAVLEHVNNLEATIGDISSALKVNGISIHNVDLRSHGLDREHTLDFLTLPDKLYQLMYSHKGYPNRSRVDHYRDAVGRSGMRFQKLVATERMDFRKVDLIYDRLARPFNDISREELCWLGFWMILEHDQ